MTKTLAPPTTAADWETYIQSLNTPAEFMAAFNDGTFHTNMTAFVTAKTQEADEIRAQVAEQVQLAMRDLHERAGADPDRAPVNLSPERAAGSALRNLAISNPDAPGAGLNGVCKSLPEFLNTVWHGARLGADGREKLARINDYQEKIPSEGGFMVPEEFRTDLLIQSLTDSVVRPRAQVIPMSSETLRYPKIDETSRVSSVYGGLIVYRTEEGADLVESQAAFSSLKLEATKQTLLSHVTNELIRDWPAFQAFINATYPPAMAFFEDIDFLSGTGVGEPLGVLSPGNSALIIVPGRGGQTAATIVWQNVLDMYSRMLPASLSRAVWLASPDTFVELATMALNVGTGGSAVWLPDGTGTPTLTLLGRPVIMDEKAPGKLGVQSDLSFVDFSMYLIGDRQMTTVASSEHVKFTSDKTTFRVISRNDGRPWLDAAITPHNNGPTLSPFVTLDDRT